MSAPWDPPDEANANLYAWKREAYRRRQWREERVKLPPRERELFDTLMAGGAWAETVLPALSPAVADRMPG